MPKKRAALPPRIFAALVHGSDQAMLVDWDWRNCDDSMKFRSLSRRCESCPAKGEPARAGSEPGDGLGNGIGEA